MSFNKLIYGSEAVIDIRTILDINELETRLNITFHKYRKKPKCSFSLFERTQNTGFVYYRNKNRLNVFYIPDSKMELDFNYKIPNTAFEGKIKLTKEGSHLQGSVGPVAGSYTDLIFRMALTLGFCVVYLHQSESAQMFIPLIFIFTLQTVIGLIALKRAHKEVIELAQRIRNSLEPQEQ